MLARIKAGIKKFFTQKSSPKKLESSPKKLESLGTKLESERKDLRKLIGNRLDRKIGNSAVEINTWGRVPDLRELLLEYTNSTQEGYLTPWMVYGKTVTPVDNDIEKEIPFNPIFWEFETKYGDTYLGKLSTGLNAAVDAGNETERAKYMKINNLYSICLMICMNHEMNYGIDLLLIENNPTTKEWYYNFKYQTMSDLLVNGYKYVDPYEISAATSKSTFLDSRLKRKWLVTRKRIFYSNKKSHGTLDLNKLDHRTVWVAAVFLHKVQDHEEGKCKLQALLDFIPKMQNVLQKFDKEDPRLNDATNTIVLVRRKCNLKF